ncbi:PAS domain-containing protein [Desulfofundulus thermobenzoicus]|uniref:PAS domain-containing protein n=1 Tax=Desulfofundulus thermobenzoicus TaxID=29376 RepID=A0A6N7IQ69_9FIRM|nr:sigma 54-interacting transcriptional regulator [Desulfofundulus thermobenzoicus]MQL51707.1 PAS domain-containing protein [Desulfofundulus thermobenzoicus]HHW45213.1 sigma 54-interacting transcriptional regulator [Desulfotomaculum sp.]
MTISRLMKIKDSAQHAAIAIAAALGVEVAVIDTDCILVATSKGYVEGKGAQIHRPYIETVLKEKVIICHNPGNFPLCAGCRFEGNCPEKAEVLCAIDMDGEMIGVITMIAFNNEQRNKLLENTGPLLEFIREMGELLIGKIREREAMERMTEAHRLIETTLDSVNDGIITFDWKGKVTHANKVACRLLGVKSASLVGAFIDNLLPGKNLLETVRSGRTIQRQEYISSGANPVHCLISVKPIYMGEQVTGAVLSLSDFRDVRSVVYEFAGMKGNTTFDAIIGASEQITELKRQAMQIARSDSTILIQAESGTGKELFARAIHSASPRAKGSFVAINCAAIPETLLESELFGYEEGAFTGAKRGGKPGKFELADGGTLFLDEIGDMPLHLQAKLLRVLQERQVERVGGTRNVSIDVRIIAATHQDLETKVQTGEFRSDLFYRLNVIPLIIPPLRERKSDIMVLSKYFLKKYNQKLRKKIQGFTYEAAEVLQQYHWPGNVRELENAIEYAVNVENGTHISATSLPKRVLGLSSKPLCSSTPLAERVKRYELNQIMDALRRYGAGVSGKQMAARELGISVPTLYRKIKNLKGCGEEFIESDKLFSQS